MFLISLEINPACSQITCQNGGSCIYISEISNAVCSCYRNFAGEFCEGIIFRSFFSNKHVNVLFEMQRSKHVLKCNTRF